MANPLSGTVFSVAKLLLYDRVRQAIRGNSPEKVRINLDEVYPITLELGPSGRCNNRCSFCMHGKYYNNGKVMPLETYTRFIDEVTNYPEDRQPRGMIFSSSGEPLTNPHINDFIKYTKYKGMDVALITNGTALRRKGVIETILDNVSWTRISLNAGTSETRSKIHGVGLKDYENVLGSLKILGRGKEFRHSPCHIGAQIVVTEDNYKEIGLATRRVKDTGIDYFQIKPVVFHPRDGREQLGNEFWRRVLEVSEKAKAKNQDASFDVFVKYNQFEEIMAPNHDRDAYPQCLASFFPIIEADGKVYHCSQTRGLGSLELGDLNGQSFQEIWEGDRRKEVLADIDVSTCQPVCRCHPNNKFLTELANEGITPNIQESLDRLKENGGCAPSFV